MKKFLPLIFFVLAFSGVMVWQIGMKKLQSDPTFFERDNLALEYEKDFYKGEYKSLEGETISLSKIKAPLVIVNFWASWCKPCLEEMPSLLNLKKSFGEKIAIVAVNTDQEEQLKNINKIKTELKIGSEFTIIPDQKGELTTLFDVSAIPVTVIYLNGQVVHTSQGPMDFNSEEFKGRVKEWLN